MIHDLAQLLSAMGFDEITHKLSICAYIWCVSLGTKYKETKNQTF